MQARYLPVVVLTTLIVAGCSGGSSSDSMPADADPAQAAPSTATVTVLLTDAHGQDWDQALATITSIELLGDNGSQTIFSGNETVDLLSLPDFYDVFAIADDIEPDTFEKVRLRVDELELVELDDDGAVVQSVIAQLVGNGKIDLNPQGSFFVGPGDTLFIEIDFDMNKAFKTVTTGNGKLIVRPVIKVTITRQEPAGRLTRLRGFVDDIDAESGYFALCQSELVATMVKGGGDDDDDDDRPDRGCIVVATDELTGVFGADGLPVTFEDLLVNDLVTAIGRLRRAEEDERDIFDGESDDDDDESDDDDGSDDDDESDDDGSDDDGDDKTAAFGARKHRHFEYLVLDAFTIEIGEDFRRVKGIAAGIVMGDTFGLALEPGQDLGTALEVLPTQIFEQTRFFAIDGTELDSAAIAADVGVLADGVLAPADAEPDLLRAALLILDLDIDDAEQVLRGEIVSINFDAGTLQLLVDGAERCVDANAADIFLVSNTDGFSSERVDLGELEPMQRADVFGEHENDAGCFVATDILAGAIAGNALPVADAGPDQAVTAGGSVMLNGSASSDADGDPLTYTWQLTARPETSVAELAADDTAMPSFTADQAGEYVIELVVNDGTEDSAPDTVTVTATVE